jgi:hypothetical protein
MQSSDLSPGHRVTPSILAKPIESQPAEITQLFFSQPLRRGDGRSRFQEGIDHANSRKELSHNQLKLKSSGASKFINYELLLNQLAAAPACYGSNYSTVIETHLGRSDDLTITWALPMRVSIETIPHVSNALSMLLESSPTSSSAFV